jgi:two-component system response regulator DesR
LGGALQPAVPATASRRRNNRLQQESRSLGSQAGRPLRTFVVEPQALIAKALHSFLSRKAIIRMVGDAPAVRVDDLERTRPDLLVYGLDAAAHDVSEAIALARGVLSEVRFCVLSSHANPDIVRRSIASGADAFVVKDVSPGEFDAALRRLAAGAPYVDPRVGRGLLERPTRAAAIVRRSPS